MKNNPANAIKDNMWDFLKDGSYKNASVKQLKESVYDLIGMTTQKGGGDHPSQFGRMMPFEMLDLVKWLHLCFPESWTNSKRGKTMADENSEGLHDEFFREVCKRGI